MKSLAMKNRVEKGMKIASNNRNNGAHDTKAHDTARHMLR